MNPKKIITVVLLVFVAVSILFLFIHEMRKNTEQAITENSRLSDGSGAENNTDAMTVLPPVADVNIVYYFMTSVRCPSCRKIEEYTKETVEKNFAVDLKNNRMQWRIIEVDKPENRYFINEYKLYTKSVVLVKMRKGKRVSWKNLDRVWELLGDKDAFMSYVSHEVKQFLENG